jgi:hypothetical protein
MTSRLPLVPKQFVIVSAVLLTTLFTILLILAPTAEWWALPFPRELAVYRLQTYNGGLDFTGCPFAPAERWQLIRAQPNAGVLFDTVATYATQASGQLYGLAGLRAVSSPRFAILRDSLLAHSSDSIYVYRDRPTDGWVPFSQIVAGPLFDSTMALLERPIPTFEC